MQRERSSSAGRQVHAPGQEAVIRMPVAVPIAMTVVGSEAAGQAAWRPLTTSFHRGCLLLDGSNG